MTEEASLVNQPSARNGEQRKLVKLQVVKDLRYLPPRREKLGEGGSPVYLTLEETTRCLAIFISSPTPPNLRCNRSYYSTNDLLTPLRWIGICRVQCGRRDAVGQGEWGLATLTSHT